MPSELEQPGLQAKPTCNAESSQPWQEYTFRTDTTHGTSIGLGSFGWDSEGHLHRHKHHRRQGAFSQKVSSGS